MTRMPDLFREAEEAIFGHRHAAPRTPAPRPATMAEATAAAEPQEETVSLTTIAADIKGAIENADQWVRQVTETHLPAILAQAARYENSPIVQALESALLPPALEQQIAGMITELSKTYPAAPAQPEQPAAAQ
jgi:hypothetical protein